MLVESIRGRLSGWKLYFRLDGLDELFCTLNATLVGEGISGMADGSGRTSAAVGPWPCVPEPQPHVDLRGIAAVTLEHPQSWSCK